MEAVWERFLRYVALDTQSDPESVSCPSTGKQRVLGEMLVRELQELGAADAHMDGYGYVYASLPATGGADLPALGFIAHLDTSPDAPGAGVRPRLVRDYDGGPIVLNRERGILLDPAEYEALSKYRGQTLIVTDGATLLGADDKAGVAEIMVLVETLCQEDAPAHGKLCIAFTPDEEIGRGTERFDLERFGAQFAYTVDGGELGELQYENFNAASAEVLCHGVNIHPGSAKNKMKNALLLAMEFASLLPPAETPAHTEGYEGFFHLNGMEGTVEEARLHYIVRDHNREAFLARKQAMLDACSYLCRKHGKDCVELQLRDSYYNMKEYILPHFHLVESARRAMESCGVTPIITPIRGGTDGALLSHRGLPCPNLSTGGHHFHGRFEFIPLESMEKMVQVLLALCRLP